MLENIPGFVWGLVTGAALVVFSGFGTEAGKDLYQLVKRRFDNSPPEPQEVGQSFSPTLYKKQHCAWIPEFNTPGKESQGWKYYPHHTTQGKCYRKAKHNDTIVREYLMMTPDAEEADAT